MHHCLSREHTRARSWGCFHFVAAAWCGEVATWPMLAAAIGSSSNMENFSRHAPPSSPTITFSSCHLGITLACCRTRSMISRICDKQGVGCGG